MNLNSLDEGPKRKYQPYADEIISPTNDELADVEREYQERKDRQSLGRTWTHGKITAIEIGVWIMPEPVLNMVCVRIRRDGDPFGYRRWYRLPTATSQRRVMRAIAKLAEKS